MANKVFQPDSREPRSDNGYVESAEPWAFKSTPLTLRRFFKAYDNDQMIIDILILLRHIS